MTQKTEKDAAGKMSLATKLAQIGNRIGKMDKSARNAQQGYNYIPYSEVAGRLRELLASYNVIIVPCVKSYEAVDVVSKSGGKGIHYRLNMEFTIINGDVPEERIIAPWLGESLDYGDKGINKAETAGTKYFLMRLFNVSESGDEDGDAKTPEPVQKSVAKTVPPASSPRYTSMDIVEAKVHLGLATNMEELKATYGKLGALALNEDVIAYKDELKAKFAGDIKRKEQNNV